MLSAPLILLSTSRVSEVADANRLFLADRPEGKQDDKSTQNDEDSLCGGAPCSIAGHADLALVASAITDVGSNSKHCPQRKLGLYPLHARGSPLSGHISPAQEGRRGIRRTLQWWASFMTTTANGDTGTHVSSS